MSPKSQSLLIDVHHDVKLHAVTTDPDGAHHARPTLIFLHFWGGSSRTWSRLIPLLSSEYPTTALDFRGWGDSVGPSDPNAYSISQLADDVEVVIAHLHLDNVILVGLSMGAKVAQLIPGRGRLEGLKALVLVSPAPPTPLIMPPGASEQQIHAYETWQNADFVARNVLLSSPGNLDDEVLKQVVGDMVRGNEHARAAWPAYAMGEDIEALARKIRVPVLVVAAASDVVEPLDRVRREVCGTIPGSRLVVVPDCGHLLPLEAPNAIGEYILDIIDSL